MRSKSELNLDGCVFLLGSRTATHNTLENAAIIRSHFTIRSFDLDPIIGLPFSSIIYPPLPSLPVQFVLAVNFWVRFPRSSLHQLRISIKIVYITALLVFSQKIVERFSSHTLTCKYALDAPFPAIICSLMHYLSVNNTPATRFVCTLWMYLLPFDVEAYVSDDGEQQRSIYSNPYMRCAIQTICWSNFAVMINV